MTCARMVGETGFEPEIPSPQTHGFPRFLQDRGILVHRLCISVQRPCDELSRINSKPLAGRRRDVAEVVHIAFRSRSTRPCCLLLPGTATSVSMPAVGSYGLDVLSPCDELWGTAQASVQRD